MESAIYLVSTPIGNLKDITLRAIEVLKGVDIIFCEDTRVSIKLLNHYGIKKKLISLHKFNEKSRYKEITSTIDNGGAVAIISDAGTPLISDPGVFIVPELLNNRYKIIPIPGATAIIPAVQLSGIVDKEFIFLGFLPEKKRDFDNLWDRLEILDIPIFFYDTPHNIDKTLKKIELRYGDIEIKIAREITKKFETLHSGKISELMGQNFKGEMVVSLKLPKKNPNRDIENIAKKYIDLGFSLKDCSKILSIQTGLKKNFIYKKLLDMG